MLVRPIDFANFEIMTLQDFSEYFDVHRERVLGELIKDYQNIGETYLRQIESTIFNTDSLGCDKMQLYYQYWERRIFNAITKMVIRALAANKALWKGKPLIKMEASYVYPEMIYHPTVEELRTQLDKFNRNILESAKRFGRWWDGHCKIFEETTDKETSEKTIRYTFYDDIVRNRVIAAVNYEIVTLTYQIQTKFAMQADGYFSKQVKQIYDKNQLIKMQKSIEKSHSVTNIEMKILVFKQLRKIDIKRKSDSHQNSLVLVDYSDCKRNAMEKVDEWLQLFGKVLNDIAKAGLVKITKRIREYHEMLGKDMTGIDQIKALLNVIAEIKNKSMDFELQIVEAQEQFRVLKLHKYETDEQDQKDVNSLSQSWNELLDLAYRKDFEVIEFKQSYATITKDNVRKFKEELDKSYSEYLRNGPGAEHVSLEEGCEMLAQSKDQCAAFKITKDENVLSETLFDLEISNYQTLTDMIEKNKVYDQIYDIYKKHRETVKEWSMLPWSKLDIAALEMGANQHEKMVKKLQNNLKMAESFPPFIKLRTTVQGFKGSLPLIQELKHPAV